MSLKNRIKHIIFICMMLYMFTDICISLTYINAEEEPPPKEIPELILYEYGG